MAMEREGKKNFQYGEDKNLEEKIFYMCNTHLIYEQHVKLNP